MVSEKELINGCKTGKPKYQRILYQQFSGVLMGICMRYMRDITEAEDVLHDSFVKIFVNIASFRGEGSLEAWLKRIVVNTAINSYNKKISIGYGLDVDEFQEVIADIRIRETDSMTVDLLMKFVNELADGYRTVFNLHEIDGYSHNQIAEMLGCKPVTVRSQLLKAKQALKKKIEEHLKNRLEVL